jgi:hypothetical protein
MRYGSVAVDGADDVVVAGGLRGSVDFGVLVGLAIGGSLERD